MLLLLVAAPSVEAADLKPETLQTWDTYVRQAQASIEGRGHEQTPFLWVDETPNLAERVRAGEVVVEPAGGKSPHGVPHGLIHHWVGVVFVPQAKIDEPNNRKNATTQRVRNQIVWNHAGATLNCSVAPCVFHIPSSLEAITVNRYWSGRRLV